MLGKAAGERGQAMVEFALFGTVFLILTVGLVDVGRAFWDYNAVASAARFAARYGAVQGGTCGGIKYESTADWCNQLGNTTNYFWGQYGNYPLASDGTCPSSYTSGSTSFYQLSDSSIAKTTIVGAIEQRLNSNSSDWKITSGNWTAGLDPSQVYVCISIPTTNKQYDATRSVTDSNSPWEPNQGTVITVNVYYRFQPASGLLGKNWVLDLGASSRYTVE